MLLSWRRLARRWPVFALWGVALVLTATAGLLSGAYRAVGLLDDGKNAEQQWCREIARGPHPCNVCGHDRSKNGSAAAPFPYSVSDGEQSTRSVIRIETGGQFGNNLFQYAAALVTVAEHSTRSSSRAATIERRPYSCCVSIAPTRTGDGCPACGNSRYRRRRRRRTEGGGRCLGDEGRCFAERMIRHHR